MTTMILLTQLASASAFFYSLDTSPFLYADEFLRSQISTTPSWQQVSMASTPSWRCTKESCSLTYPVAHLKQESIRLTLDGSGTKLTIAGERKIEGCACQPRDDVSIALPFTPRIEDIQSKLDQAERLTITLPKHVSMPEPVVLEIKKPADEKPAEEANKLHFVPHASAAEPSAEDKVKSGLAKFRAVAAVSGLAHSNDSGAVAADQEAAATAAGSTEAGAATPQAS